MNCKDYHHQIQYYETDQMKVVHHSNYIRWMEEARVDLLSQIGCSYHSMEEAGVMSPVLEVSCQYRHSMTFGQTALIHTWLESYNGIRMTIGYQIRSLDGGQLCAQGSSSHCFLDRSGHPLSLKRSYPQWDQLFRSMLEKPSAAPTSDPDPV